MKAILGILATLALTLLIINGIVFGLDDDRLFVPPPEAVAEGFIRQMISRRYERAVPYLSDELASHVDADSLRSLGEELQARIGDHGDVHGEEGSIHGDSATARAVITTGHGTTINVPISLTRENGLWRVAQLNGLHAASIPDSL